MFTNTSQELNIKPEQWDLPVSMNAEGGFVTLREFVQDRKSALAFATLDDDQRASLTARRIELQPKFELGVLGAGIVDKDRAIAEVSGRTSIGRTLIEIESRIIGRLLEEVEPAEENGP